MGPLVLTDAGLSLMATNVLQAAAGAVKGMLNGAFLGLIAAPFTPTRGRVIGDVTEPTYTTYARQGVTWGVPDVLSQGGWGALATGVYSFKTTPGDPSILVYGYFLATAATAGVLLGAGLFDAPFPLVDSNAVVALVPEFVFPTTNDWGRAAQLG